MPLVGGNPRIPTDEVERLFRRLVANLAALDPTRLSRPFPVADIPRSLVPYRTHRLALRFETSEDYEMAVLRLLAGEGGYVVVQPDEVGAAFAQELLSPNPDTRLFQRHGTASVHLDPEQVAHALGRPMLAEPAEPHDDGSVVSIFARTTERPPAEGEGEPRFTLEEEIEGAPPPSRPGRRVAGTGTTCAYCGGELPIGRVVLFCPHCGQNVGVVHCPTCGSELDVGWQFCIACGQQVGGEFA